MKHCKIKKAITNNDLKFFSFICMYIENVLIKCLCKEMLR